MIKRLIIIALVLVSYQGIAQDKFKLGAEISPAWHINLQRQISTGLVSNSSGYGFNVGVPVRWVFGEYMSLQTGLTFELMMFDDRFNKQLLSSNRHGSLNVPIILNYQLTGGWNAIFGVGVNYNFMNTQWTPIGKISLQSATNVFQPYAALGISTLMERGMGDFELGVQGRFHFIDLYKNSGNSTDFTNWILSFDLILRYYLFNK